MTFDEWYTKHGSDGCKSAMWEAWTASRVDVIALLDGIDKDECEDDAGWWETSAGAAFGKAILQSIMESK